MITSRLIRHVSIVLALGFCSWPSLSRGDTVNVVTWTQTTPGLFLSNSTYSGALQLEAAMPTNAGLYVSPTPYTSGLNLEDTDLVIQTPGGPVEAAAYQNIYNMIATGYNNTFWTGTTQTVNGNQVQTGIFSDTTAYNAAHGTSYPSGAVGTGGLTGLAVVMNDGQGHDPSYTSFGINAATGLPVTVNSDSILVEYTYNGDTGLDGSTQSFNIINAINGYIAFQQGNPGGSGWSNGESDYSGNVDSNSVINDLNAYEYFQNGGVSVVSPPGSGTFETVVDSASFASPAVGVPEPSTGVIAIVALIGLFAMGRRRRAAMGV